MIIVAGTMTVRPDAIDLVRKMIPNHTKLTMAEEGCKLFSLGISDEEKGLVTILEIWQDDAALAHHHEHPYASAFVTNLGESFLSFDLKVYDVAGVRPLPEIRVLADIPH